MEWSEITRELFVFITENEYTTQVENKELYNRFLYNVKGVRLQRIDNFLTCVSQYYIEDINA